MKEKIFSKTAIISVMITLFVYLGAILIYLYANGWRVDIFNREILQTGVLTVESDPSLSTLTVNGENKGRTPKSLNLNVGRYDISVKKDNYRDWIKNIEIKKEKSTPIFVWLIKETFEEKELFSKDEEFIKSWISRYQDSIIFLTKVINPEGSEFTYTYNLWSYNTNPAFWDFSNNPFVLTSFQGNDDFAIELDLSTNGKLAILTYNSESYLLDTSKNVLVTDLRKLNINGFDNYTRNWSKDNNYLILESDADIISYDLQRDTKYLLLKKNDSEKYIYSTDTLGFFYLIKEDPENKRDNIYTYDLTQRKLDGSNISLILDNMYFQKNENYIKSYREDRESKNVFICEPFTNSPECTQSIGSVQSIDINHDTKGIFIKTDLATYWYNIEDSKYLMVSAYPADLIAYSPDQKRLLYKDSLGVNIFTFTKEEADHTVVIGSKNILSDIEKTSNYQWLSNSSFISYIDDGSLFVIDIDGENMNSLVDTTLYENTLITSSNENIVVLENILENEKSSFRIKQLIIN